jgi:hypothetical protein
VNAALTLARQILEQSGKGRSLDDFEDKRPLWRRLEFAAVTAIVVTLLCVIIGQSAEQLASNTVLEAAQSAKSTRNFNAIDYAATGSIGAAKVVIGPCDTRQP